MDSPDGWGHKQGQKVYIRLLDLVKNNPGKKIFQVSLEGVQHTDASFPRESVIEIAKKYRGDKGFCLTDVTDSDLLDNWSYAAEKKNQPIIVWDKIGYQLLGVQPTRGTVDLLDYALSVPSITTVKAAEKLNLKLTNASSKLKYLWEKGFLLRQEELASSGGIEFVYFRIK